MYLVYVDETGDTGLENSPTHFYCLTTLLIHEDHWQEHFNRIKEMRLGLRARHSVKLNEELHATDIVSGHGISYKYRLNQEQRLDIFAQTIQCISMLEGAKMFSVCICKDSLTRRDFDVLGFAWTLLSTRVHYTVNRLNSVTGRKDKTILIPDDSQNIKIRKLLRKLRVFNPIWADGRMENIRLDSIIEDPLFSASTHSYFLQMCDMVAYVAVAKNVKIRKFEPYQFEQIYQRLDPVLEKSVCKENAEAIVYFPKIKRPANRGA